MRKQIGAGLVLFVMWTGGARGAVREEERISSAAMALRLGAGATAIPWVGSLVANLNPFSNTFWKDYAQTSREEFFGPKVLDHSGLEGASNRHRRPLFRMGVYPQPSSPMPSSQAIQRAGKGMPIHQARLADFMGSASAGTGHPLIIGTEHSAAQIDEFVRRMSRMPTNLQMRLAFSVLAGGAVALGGYLWQSSMVSLDRAEGELRQDAPPARPEAPECEGAGISFDGLEKR